MSTKTDTAWCAFSGHGPSIRDEYPRQVYACRKDQRCADQMPQRRGMSIPAMRTGRRGYGLSPERSWAARLGWSIGLDVFGYAVRKIGLAMSRGVDQTDRAQKCRIGGQQTGREVDDRCEDKIWQGRFSRQLCSGAPLLLARLALSSRLVTHSIVVRSRRVWGSRCYGLAGRKEPTGQDRKRQGKSMSSASAARKRQQEASHPDPNWSGCIALSRVSRSPAQWGAETASRWV